MRRTISSWSTFGASHWWRQRVCNRCRHRSTTCITFPGRTCLAVTGNMVSVFGCTRTQMDRGYETTLPDQFGRQDLRSVAPRPLFVRGPHRPCHFWEWLCVAYGSRARTLRISPASTAGAKLTQKQSAAKRPRPKNDVKRSQRKREPS